VRGGNGKFEGDRIAAFFRSLHAQDFTDLYLFRFGVAKNHPLPVKHSHPHIEETSVGINYEGHRFNSNSLAILHSGREGYGNTQNNAFASAAASRVRSRSRYRKTDFVDLVRHIAPFPLGTGAVEGSMKPPSSPRHQGSENAGVYEAAERKPIVYEFSLGENTEIAIFSHSVSGR